MSYEDRPRPEDQLRESTDDAEPAKTTVTMVGFTTMDGGCITARVEVLERCETYERNKHRTARELCVQWAERAMWATRIEAWSHEPTEEWRAGKLLCSFQLEENR